jgi:methylamine---glutamate N-methyltransferase subunit C
MTKQDYLKAEDTPENTSLCLCPTCPSHPQQCRSERLYCARGVSKCDIQAAGCLCPTCPVWEKYGLNGNYYCDKLPQGSSGEVQRKGVSSEPPGFRNMVIDIKDTSILGKSSLAEMGSLRELPFSLDDLFFLPAQVSRFPLNADEEVGTAVTIGPQAKRPLRLPTPVLIAGMSFGAVSKNVRLSIAHGAKEGGFGFNTGEGGILPEEQALAPGTMIAQYATGRFGIPEDRLGRAAAVEIRFGQGAYPGTGSILPKGKVTAEVARIRGVREGEDVLSPARHPDISSPAAVREKVAYLRQLTKGAPIGAKIGCGRIEDDLDVLLDAGVDFITLDGFGGGTAATEMYARENCGIPIVAALPRAIRHLHRKGARDRITVIASGGLRSSGHFAKCLALGADAVYIGTATLIAINCQQYRICYGNKCPTGVTTHDLGLVSKISPNESGRRLASFVGTSTREMAGLARITGKSRLQDLARDDLISVDRDLAEVTGVQWIDGRDRWA